MNNTIMVQTSEIDENPSLNQLYDFIEKKYTLLSPYEQEFFNKDTFNVIEYYIYGKLTGALYGLLKIKQPDTPIQSAEKKTTFYLGGLILYNTNEPITQEMINKVQDKINKTDMSLCWGMEIYSVMEHNKRFENFKKFYYNYKEFITHYKYSPDNIGYIKAKEHFENYINNTN